MLFVSFSYSQKKEKIIFLFEDGKDLLKENKNEDVFKIDKKHSFMFSQEKQKKIDVSYNSIKESLITYDAFLVLNKGKKYPDYFNEYLFYIYQPKNDSLGCLIEVEKIWLVEDKIID